MSQQKRPLSFKKQVLLLIFCVNGYYSGLSAATADSTLPAIPSIISIYSEREWSEDQTPRGLDTGFYDLNHPDPIVCEGGQHLGLIGSPARSNWGPAKNSIYGWTGLTSLDQWLLRNEQVDYYRTNKRLTRIDYHMASFREQSIEAFHTQNILKHWNAGVKFRRFNVKDFLPRSDTYYNRFLFFTDYASVNNRYHLFANAIWNSLRNQLSGGIVSDTFFLGKEMTNRDMRGLPVFLTGAGNRTREKSFNASHYFYLTSPSDSAQFRLQATAHSNFIAGSSTYFDEENDSTSLYDYYYDGLTSYDSVGYRDLRNKVGFDLEWRSSEFKFAFSPFAEHQYYQYWQDTGLNRSNMSAGTEASLRFSRLKLAVRHQSVITGDDQGNYSTKATASIGFRNWELTATVSNSRSAVPLLYQSYQSNHLRWSNSFDPLRNLRTGISLQQDILQLSINAELDRTQGFLYMGKDAAPEVHDAPVRVMRLSLKKDFTWRKWHMENRIRLQEVNETDVLHLPEIGLMHSVYWERDLLNKAFILTAGIRFRYQSAYYGDEFMPASGFYYLQDSTFSAGQPLFDLFADMRIKSATVYLASENVMQDITSETYYMTPGYPQAGRTFRFGVRWFFMDQ